ncbi:MAG: preprotein translocase subunit SecY [Candidatus Undinarchaeales archaeon]
MGIKSLLMSLPSVSAPEKRLGFKEKLKWTAIPLLLFFILGEITLFGLPAGATGDIFGELRVVLASNFGTLLTLGIGPIVMSSIIIQLLSGAGVFEIDTSTEEGKSLYQGAQKFLAILFTLFEGMLLVFSGQIDPSPALISSSGMGFASGILIFQILLGGLLLIYLDEIVSKWGFGSGIGLFIAGGVSKSIIIRSFDPLRLGPGQPINGAIPAFINSLMKGSFEFIRQYPNDMLAFTATIIVFAISMYAQSIKVEVPLSYGRIRGLSRRYPLPFVYASVMPVIFISALLANLRFWVSILQRGGYEFLGYFDPSGQAHGAISYILPYSGFAKDIIQQNLAMTDIIHAVVYFSVMVGGAVVFSKLWVGVSGMTSDKLAQKLLNSGMQIPGFRSDKRIIEKVLKRYVPYLTILGGAFVGGLASIAEFTGALGGGTGILLTVGIIYKLYQEIASEQLMEMHPAIRNFIGEHGII